MSTSDFNFVVTHEGERSKDHTFQNTFVYATYGLFWHIVFRSLLNIFDNN